VTTPAYDVLLFDLGGVLIDFSGPAELADLLAAPPPVAEIKRRWGLDPCVAALERGASDPATFARCFLDAWGLQLSTERFLALFATWSKRWLPGAVQLLAELRPHYRLACLSNSNPLHWQRNYAVHRIHENFEVCLASHELRCLKPEPEIFAHALGRLGAPAERVVFFDDSQVNVAGARAVGIDAHHVEGVEALRRELIALGVLRS